MSVGHGNLVRIPRRESLCNLRTRAGRHSPSNGQPNAVEIVILRAMRRLAPAFAISKPRGDAFVHAHTSVCR
jgi:hypothetical protein